jgi:hypothetical protein
LHLFFRRSARRRTDTVELSFHTEASDTKSWRRGKTMPDYCCYCLDDLGVIRSIEVICSDSDETAKLLAMEILAAKKECSEIDLWGRAHRIHVLRR